MKQSDPQIKLRLPVEIKNWVERSATNNMRSQNAEIVLALKAQMREQEIKKGLKATA